MRLNAAMNRDKLWHCRYGHINFRDLGEMSNKGIVQGMQVSKNVKELKCTTCMISKIHVSPFPRASQH